MRVETQCLSMIWSHSFGNIFCYHCATGNCYSCCNSMCCNCTRGNTERILCCRQGNSGKEGTITKLCSKDQTKYTQDSGAIIEKVRFLGKIEHSDLVSYYQSAGAVVIPSKAEAFGLVAIEAMGTKNLIFMTNLGSGPELISDGDNGFLVDFREPENAAKKIFGVFNDPELCQKVADKALETGIGLYSKKAIVEQNYLLYKDLIEGS